MFISVNNIPVKKGREADFEKMFIERDRVVEKQEGFVSLDILKPGKKRIMGGAAEDLPHEYQVMTRWESEEAFRKWVGSEDFKKSHSREIDKTVFDGQSYLTLYHSVEGAGAQKEMVKN
ncbi:MAG: antibiotic biosynthesis monooxygenase [Candidatus Obscuribacterales bacterium]|nr:antibiotic biosynthesis monooxygenase [Candidatus Obscuribacterales bacterium]